MSVATSKHQPEMHGLFVTDPNASEYDEPIYVDEVISALAAATRSADEAFGADDADRAQGLLNASIVLAAILKNRYSSEPVSRKNRVRAPKPKPANPATPEQEAFGRELKALMQKHGLAVPEEGSETGSIVATEMSHG